VDIETSGGVKISSNSIMEMENCQNQRIIIW